MDVKQGCQFHPERDVQAICSICGAALCKECISSKCGVCQCSGKHNTTVLWRIMALLMMLAILPVGYLIGQASRPGSHAYASEMADQVAQEALKRVKAGCEDFASQMRRYPTPGEGLGALVLGKRATDTPEPVTLIRPMTSELKEGQITPSIPEGKDAPVSDLIPGWRGPYLPLEAWDKGFHDGLGGFIIYKTGESISTSDGRFIEKLGPIPPPPQERQKEDGKANNG